MLQHALALFSGSIVGFTLGVIGGGGSVLAVPLLLYLVGVSDPHVAIGTSSLAVAINAFANLIPHARARHVRWRSAALFALVGVAGAAVGSTIGKSIDGRRLLILFALLMVVIAVLMQRRRPAGPGASAILSRKQMANVSGAGLAAGMLSGFFGIGGGFLVVPGLVFATGMSTIDAIGSSLVAVGAFGSTTATNYAISGLVNWTVAVEFIAGGIAGGWAGAHLAAHLSRDHTLLNRVFGGVLIVVAAYMIIRSVNALT